MSEFRFSVVVPTFNRPERVTQCLRALAGLDEPAGGWELLVVNDGGVAVPSAALALVRSGSARAVRVLTQKNRGPAAARNLGAVEARGEVVAFIDDDCVADRGWLAALDTVLRDVPDALVGGSTSNALASNPFASASQLLADFVASRFDGRRAERFFTSNNLAVARKLFLESGGFDESFPRAAGEDREFCDRWSAQGRPSTYAPAARVLHAHDLSLRGFLRQHYAYGRGAAVFRRVRAGRDRPVAIDLGFYPASLRYAFVRSAGVGTFTVPLLVGLAHASYVCGLAAGSAAGRRAALGGRSSAAATAG
jgi:glycosyltransferase involved in cell wall biosynthesis